MRIVPLQLRAANDFVEQWHRHSARTSNDGGKFAIGLEHGAELIGVAIVGLPRARLLAQEGTAELLRLCTSPEAPKGSGSKLYARARRIWQLMGGTRLITYTLTRESGSIMRGAGIHEADGEVAPDGWDRPGRARKHQAIYDQPKLRWSEDLETIPP